MGARSVRVHRSAAQTLDSAPALRTLSSEKMGSQLPAAGFFALRFLARLLLQLGRELMLGFADLIQQLVEPFRRHLLARRQWPQHVHQQQTNSDDLGQGRIVPLCIACRPSPQDRLAAPFPERPTIGLRRCFQLGVLFFADFETDGFRAQRRLHHVPAFSLAITAETSSRA